MNQLADFPDRGDALVVIAVDAQGIGFQFQGMTANRGDRALATNLLDLRQHFLTCVHGAGPGTRQQFAIVIVTAIGEGFEPEFDAEGRGFLAMLIGLRGRL